MQAWNVDTGKQAWTHNYAKSPNWGSMLATGGGLVFTGGTSDRKIHAFDATTGKLLWEFPTQLRHLAPPPTFRSTASSTSPSCPAGAATSRGMQATLNRLLPGEYPQVPTGGSVYVFAVD